MCITKKDSKDKKVSVKLCMLYLRVWLSYVCQPAKTKWAKWETERISAYYVGVSVSHIQLSLCVFSVARADREESVSEIYILLQWSLSYFSDWYPDRTTTVFCRVTVYVIALERTGVHYSYPTAAKTLNSTETVNKQSFSQGTLIHQH